MLHINVMRIHEVLISYGKLDRTLYSINCSNKFLIPSTIADQIELSSLCRLRCLNSKVQ